MCTLKNFKWLSRPDTFTYTVYSVFRTLSGLFILMSYIWASLNSMTITEQYLMPFNILSIVSIILILFVEPITYKMHPLLNFIINILIAVSCGLLFYTYRNNIIAAVFFINTVIIGLKSSIVKSFIISCIYYGAYILAAVYGRGTAANMVLFDVHILILLFSEVYLCHYFSRIEYKKNQQDEEFMHLIDEKIQLIQELQNKNLELEETYWEMVETLIGIIEARDNFTGGHSVNVCEYSVKLAKKLDLNDQDISKIMKASILHDIGKMGIPDNILLKPGALSSEEYETIMNHPEIGCKVLMKIKGLEEILPMILYHHERIDGTGYPYGVKGNRIPVGARIIAIADAYDAMTSNRPYRKALLRKEAKKRLLEGSGLQFDQDFVCKFIEIIDSDNAESIMDFRSNELDRIKKFIGMEII